MNLITFSFPDPCCSYKESNLHSRHTAQYIDEIYIYIYGNCFIFQNICISEKQIYKLLCPTAGEGTWSISAVVSLSLTGSLPSRDWTVKGEAAHWWPHLCVPLLSPPMSMASYSAAHRIGSLCWFSLHSDLCCTNCKRLIPSQIQGFALNLMVY